jgi:glycosyltransferase involved in cell wall biosynthesis
LTIYYALSAYPLSQSFQSQLEALAGEPVQFLLLSQLRQKNPLGLLKFLRQLKATQFFLVIEDQNSQVLLPILQLIAKISTPKKMTVVHANLQFQTIKTRDVALSSLKLIKASIAGGIDYHLANKKMRMLLSQPPRHYNLVLSNTKNILYLNANLWFGVKAGGSVGHIAGVVNAFANKGFNVDYAAADQSSLLAKTINHLQLPVLNAFGIPAELNYYYFNNKIGLQLKNKNKNKNKWDFIYQRLSVANFSGALLSLQLNIPLILEYNGSEVWVAKNWGRALRYHDAAVKAEEVCLKHAHLIVTISKVLKQELIDRGINANKIVCYPNCIDPTMFNPQLFSKETTLSLRQKHHLTQDAFVFTFVGTFGPWHGVDILAKTIRLLIDEHKSWLQSHNVHFMLVGDGAKMCEVRAMLDNVHCAPYVTLTGLVPQLEAPAYLAASDVLLSPHIANQDGSRFFGSPTKLFEYMAMEKPIIASDLEQIGEVLEQSLRAGQLPNQQPDASNQELAILCEPGNMQHLIEAIQFIAETSPWRGILGTNARQEALKKYTWDKHVDAFLN